MSALFRRFRKIQRIAIGVDMGGLGSGRSGGGPTVESAFRLDVHRLIQEGALQPGANRTTTTTWTNTYSNEVTLEVAIQARMADPDDAEMRLVHRLSGSLRNGPGKLQDYIVDLTWTMPPYGGRRWWFICPLSGKRVGTLLFPDGAHSFASRERYGLTYYTQRTDRNGRALRKMHKLRAEFGSTNVLDQIVRPLGMHQATFDRKLNRIIEAETVAMSFLRLKVEAMNKRSGL